MLRCPHCEPTKLTRSAAQSGILWVCRHCQGRAANLALFRKLASGRNFQILMSSVRNAGKGENPCPSCRIKMSEIYNPDLPRIDVCLSCQLIWFDRDEIESWTEHHPGTQPISPDHLDIDKALVLEKIRIDSEEKYFDGDHVPEEFWKLGPAILGLPVERSNFLTRVPWLTWLFIILNIGIAFLTFPKLEAVIADWAFLPHDPWRHSGLTFITALFLHAGILHLIGNMYFLSVFGDNVEDRLGHWFFFALYFLSGFAGTGLHDWIDPRSAIPLVGASGAISGVVLFYGLSFPKAKIHQIIVFRWISVPAILYVGFWFAFQAVMFLVQLRGNNTGVSYAGHFGGALIGILFWLLFRGTKIKPN